MALLAVMAGIFSLAATAVSWSYLVESRGMSPTSAPLYAAGIGLTATGLISVVALWAGRRLERGSFEEAERSELDRVFWPELEDIHEADGSSCLEPSQLGPPAEAIAAEVRGAPGPALRRFLLFATRPIPRRRRVLINDAVEVLVRVLRHTPGSGLVSFDPDPHVGEGLLDLDLFHRLLLSLIQNAREASGPRGRIDLRTQAMNGTALVAVRDDGPGVPPGSLERIFKPFYSTKRGAMGLGLPICRQIAEAHGGSIAAANIVPRGLEVGVTLPMVSTLRQVQLGEGLSHEDQGVEGAAAAVR